LTSSPPFGVRVSSPAPGEAVIAVEGEIDVDTAEMLTGALLDMTRRGAITIEVDLTDSTFMDCSGVNALVSMKRVASEHRCAIRVSHPSAATRRLLDVCGLLEALRVGPPRPPST
jgi:anti-sigma B factor antagonist